MLVQCRWNHSQYNYIYIYVYTQIGLSSPFSSYTPSHTGHTALSDVCEAFCLELLVVCFLCFALAFFAAFCCFSSSLFFLCFSWRFHLFFFLCFSDLLCLPLLKESRHLFTREVAVQLTFLWLSSLPVAVLESSVHLSVADHCCMMEGCMLTYRHDLEQGWGSVTFCLLYQLGAGMPSSTLPMLYRGHFPELGTFHYPSKGLYPNLLPWRIDIH